jgi:hypothetical protein
MVSQKKKIAMNPEEAGAKGLLKSKKPRDPRKKSERLKSYLKEHKKRVIFFSLAFVLFFAWYIPHNLEVNSVWYASHMKHSKNTDPVLVEVMDNLNKIYLPNVVEIHQEDLNHQKVAIASTRQEYTLEGLLWRTNEIATTVTDQKTILNTSYTAVSIKNYATIKSGDGYPFPAKYLLSFNNIYIGCSNLGRISWIYLITSADSSNTLKIDKKR